MYIVTTLALGSRPKQGLAKVWGKSEPESHISCSWECKKVREWTPTLPNELPLWEFKSQWTFESLEGDYKGQNSLDWNVLYIITKLLKPKYLKWARITHLDS